MKRNVSWKARVFRAAMERFRSHSEHGYMATDANGSRCEPTAPDAVRWCSIGAVVSEAHNSGVPYVAGSRVLVDGPQNPCQELCLDMHMFAKDRKGRSWAEISDNDPKSVTMAMWKEFGEARGYL